MYLWCNEHYLKIEWEGIIDIDHKHKVEFKSWIKKWYLSLSPFTQILNMKNIPKKIKNKKPNPIASLNPLANFSN